MAKRAIFLCIALLAPFTDLSAQESSAHRSAFPEGLSVQFGPGSYSVTDDYISPNRYSGALSSFSTRWSRFHGNHGHRLVVTGGGGTDIRMGNASTEITVFGLSGIDLYPLTTYPFLSKTVFTYLGPSWDLFFHVRNQNMTPGALTKTTSLAILASGGINLAAILPFSSSFQTESSVGSSVFALGMRMPNTDNEDATFARLLLFPNAVRSRFRLSTRYRPIDSVSVGVGYEMHFTWLKSSEEWETEDGWYGFTSTNNNVFLSLTWHLGDR